MIMKHQHLKPIVLLLLAVLLAPVQALAIEFSVDGISYSTTSAWEVEVVRTAGDYQGDVVIPGAVTYEGTTYRVTAIGESAIMGPNVTSLTLPEGTIRTIKYRGCYDLRNVTSITVPASVTEIGEEAFKFCSSLTDLFFHSPKPPTVASNTFANISKTDCKIHVPTGSLTDYQALPEITAFSNVDEWGYFEVYDLKVAGCLVTENNLDVFGDGSAVFNTTTTTLTINKDITTTLANQPVVYNEGVAGLTINLDNCTLTAIEAFCVDVRNDKETVLTGTGTIEGNVFAVYCWAPLTIQDATLNFSGGIFGSTVETLLVKNSSLMGTVASGSAISGFDSIGLSDCFFQSPTGANHNGTQLVDGSGNPASSFVIKAGTPTSYGLYLAGTQVTDANCYDILGGGEASYDPTSNTLTLYDDISTTTVNAIRNVIPGLNIDVPSDVTLSSSFAPVLDLANSAVISGSGTLTLKGSNTTNNKCIRVWINLSIKDATVKLEDCNQGIGGLETTSFTPTLTIENANVQGTALSGDSFIKDFTKVTLKDCFYEEPAGAKYEDKQLVDMDGNAAASVKIVPGKRTYPELSFPRDSYIASVGKTFTAPELNNVYKRDVTYASSNAAVAEVNATTGEVTVKGKGMTTISATFAGDDTYYADKASYYLVVSKQEGLQYDVNLDGKVTITDAVSVVNAILNGTGE